jgi:hypothetical protein
MAILVVWLSGQYAFLSVHISTNSSFSPAEQIVNFHSYEINPFIYMLSYPLNKGQICA